MEPEFLSFRFCFPLKKGLIILKVRNVTLPPTIHGSLESSQKNTPICPVNHFLGEETLHFILFSLVSPEKIVSFHFYF